MTCGVHTLLLRFLSGEVNRPAGSGCGAVACQLGDGLAGAPGCLACLMRAGIRYLELGGMSTALEGFLSGALRSDAADYDAVAQALTP